MMPVISPAPQLVMHSPEDVPVPVEEVVNVVPLVEEVTVLLMLVVEVVAPPVPSVEEVPPVPPVPEARPSTTTLPPHAARRSTTGPVHPFKSRKRIVLDYTSPRPARPRSCALPR